MNNAVNSKRVFYVAPHRPQGFAEMLGKRDDIRLDMLEQKVPDAAALEILGAAHAYQTGSARDELVKYYHAGTELLDRTPNLLLVSTNGAGYDTVDMKLCTARGILVVNQSGGNAEAVAEHVIGMMLCLSKRVGESDRAIRAGKIERRIDYIGREAYGKTIGIVGLGHVGRRVAELAGMLFRMQVLAYDPYLDAATVRARGATKVELDELPRRSDFVSINCPLTPETRNLIGAREYALMQPTAYFITTARGSIHDEEALERVLRDKKIAGAGRAPADEIRQRFGYAAHGRRHHRGARPHGPDRRRTDDRCARRQAGAAHHQPAGLAGLRQALRARLRLCAARPAGRAELARRGEVKRLR